MARVRRLLAAIVIALVTLAGFGCGNDYLREDELYGDDPGFKIDEEAEIPDSTEHRRVLDVLAHYRQAVVRKDFGSLRRLISEEYYENAGTTDTTQDDYSAEQLPAIFELMAQKADEIKYSVTVDDVELDLERNRAAIKYQFEFAYQYDVADEAAWDAGADVNRLELKRENGQWRIIGGL